MSPHKSLSRTISRRIRSSHLEVFLGKGFLKICSKFTGEHACRSAMSIKLLCSFIEIALRHGCSPVNLLHIFRTPFLKNTSGRLLLKLLMFRLFRLIQIHLELISRNSLHLSHYRVLLFDTTATVHTIQQFFEMK